MNEHVRKIGLPVGVVVIIVAGIFAAIVLQSGQTGSSYAGEGVKPPSDPIKIPPVATGTATPTGQEKTNTAGIPVIISPSKFYEAEEWNLNTLYKGDRPTDGTIMVRVKDIESLQPFRVLNTEFSNFRFIEKKSTSSSGYITILYADVISSSKIEIISTSIKEYDKLMRKPTPENPSVGVTWLGDGDGGISDLKPNEKNNVAFTTFIKKPKAESVLYIEIHQK